MSEDDSLTIKVSEFKVNSHNVHIEMSAFCKPEKARVSQFSTKIPANRSLLNQVTVGLKYLSQPLGGLAWKPCEFGSCSNEDDHFVLRSNMVLFSRYVCRSRIEREGQSAVLIAAQDSFEGMAWVAIKVMHASYLSVGLKEVDTLRRLNCADPGQVSHTVRLLNAFMHGGHICLVFPLLNPLPLNRMIADWKLHNDEEKLKVIRKVSFHLLSALAFLKRNDTFHADVKPENVLVMNAKDVKGENIIDSVVLVDFGNAIHHTNKEVSLYYSDFDVQTLPYRAPEVCIGVPFGVEMDMWSLGCLLAELYTGKVLFPGTTRGDVLREMTKLLGPLPEMMCRRGKFGSDDDILVLSKTKILGEKTSAMELMSKLPTLRDYAFASFLSGLLCYCPDERLTPWQALQHSFMSKEICMEYFLEGSSSSSSSCQCLVANTDYSFHQIISSNKKRMCPSTYDLLRTGTQDSSPSCYAKKNVARVQPIERPKDEVNSPKDSKPFHFPSLLKKSRSSSDRQTSLNTTFVVTDYSKLDSACASQFRGTQIRCSDNNKTKTNWLNGAAGLGFVSENCKEEIGCKQDEDNDNFKGITPCNDDGMMAEDSFGSNMISCNVYENTECEEKGVSSCKTHKMSAAKCHHFDERQIHKVSSTKDSCCKEEIMNNTFTLSRMQSDNIANFENSNQIDDFDKAKAVGEMNDKCKGRPRSFDSLPQSCPDKDPKLNVTCTIGTGKSRLGVSRVKNNRRKTMGHIPGGICVGAYREKLNRSDSVKSVEGSYIDENVERVAKPMHYAAITNSKRGNGKYILDKKGKEKCVITDEFESVDKTSGHHLSSGQKGKKGLVCDSSIHVDKMSAAKCHHFDERQIHKVSSTKDSCCKEEIMNNTFTLSRMQSDNIANFENSNQIDDFDKAKAVGEMNDKCKGRPRSFDSLPQSCPDKGPKLNVTCTIGTEKSRLGVSRVKNNRRKTMGHIPGGNCVGAYREKLNRSDSVKSVEGSYIDENVERVAKLMHYAAITNSKRGNGKYILDKKGKEKCVITDEFESVDKTSGHHLSSGQKGKKGLVCDSSIHVDKMSAAKCHHFDERQIHKVSSTKDSCCKEEIMNNTFTLSRMQSDNIANFENSNQIDDFDKAKAVGEMNDKCKGRPRSFDSLPQSCPDKDPKLNVTCTIGTEKSRLGVSRVKNNRRKTMGHIPGGICVGAYREKLNRSDSVKSVEGSYIDENVERVAKLMHYAAITNSKRGNGKYILDKKGKEKCVITDEFESVDKTSGHHLSSGQKGKKRLVCDSSIHVDTNRTLGVQYICSNSQKKIKLDGQVQGNFERFSSKRSKEKRKETCNGKTSEISNEGRQTSIHVRCRSEGVRRALHFSRVLEAGSSTQECGVQSRDHKVTSNGDECVLSSKLPDTTMTDKFGKTNTTKRPLSKSRKRLLRESLLKYESDKSVSDPYEFIVTPKDKRKSCEMQTKLNVHGVPRHQRSQKKKGKVKAKSNKFNMGNVDPYSKSTISDLVEWKTKALKMKPKHGDSSHKTDDDSNERNDARFISNPTKIVHQVPRLSERGNMTSIIMDKDENVCSGSGESFKSTSCAVNHTSTKVKQEKVDSHDVSEMEAPYPLSAEKEADTTVVFSDQRAVHSSLKTYTKPVYYEKGCRNNNQLDDSDDDIILLL